MSTIWIWKPRMSSTTSRRESASTISCRLAIRGSMRPAMCALCTSSPTWRMRPRAIVPAQRAFAGPQKIERASPCRGAHTPTRKSRTWVFYARDAREQGIPVKTFTVLMQRRRRAVTDGDEEGFLKIHVRRVATKYWAPRFVARHAGEMINELSLAITAGIGLGELGRVIPCLSDAGGRDQDGRGCLLPHASEERCR